MKLTFIAANIYLALGLLAGVFYREFTKFADFPADGHTQLSVLHTHLLTLGFLVMLVVLLLDKAFDISGDSRFKQFFWIYNAGLLTSVVMMTTRGVLTVLGNTDALPAVSGIAGLGHIMLAIGLGLLMLILGPKVLKK